MTTAHPSPPPVRFGGAVLVGGASRRMGRDKATIELADGRLLAQVAVDALLDAGAVDVSVVGGGATAIVAARPRCRAVADSHPGAGPLGGVATALAHASTGIVVVLACDLPFASPVSVQAVVAALARSDADVAVPVSAGHPALLHAAWRRRCLPAVEAAFAGGERSLRGAVASLRTLEVQGLDPASTLDADTPGDLPR